MNILQPFENNSLFGHHAQKEQVSLRILHGRLGQALIFQGDRGIGKATFAFHLTWNLLQNRGNEVKFSPPEENDPLWRKIAAGSCSQCLYLTSNNSQQSSVFARSGNITVDQVRKVKSFLQHSTPDNGWRVVIVDSTDRLNQSSANALLKMLEEPPLRTVFLLICHAEEALLPTIQSRCQILHFDPLGLEDMRLALAKLNTEYAIDLSSPEAQKIIESAQGSVGNAAFWLYEGGADIFSCINSFLEEKDLDYQKLYRLADLVSDKERGSLYHYYMNREILSHIAAQAKFYLKHSQFKKAQAMADFWYRMDQYLVDLQTYNLDRKHALLTTLQKAHENLHK